MRDSAHLTAGVRSLIVILGDQLDGELSALEGADLRSDRIWMAEVVEESTHVTSHKARTALFLSAMRHFRDDLLRRGFRVTYNALPETGPHGSLGRILESALRELKPKRVVLTEPGEWRVREMIRSVCRRSGIPLVLRPDRHFLCSHEEFASHVQGRKEWRLEFFYREQRRRHGVLMEGGKPIGGAWNFDRQNRESFGREGPGEIPLPVSFSPDATTQQVLRLVERTFPNHPGSLRHFDWPVTAEQARRALTDFVEHRLACFGRFQDAMWEQAARANPFLFHSRLSSALNLKLINPRAVLRTVEDVWRRGAAPLPAVEGFVRQLMGWREYVRGVYWSLMPGYGELNALGASEPLPAFYWSADAEMRCLREVVRQTLEYGYAHHIQRLMVTGLFALLFGVHPQAIHEWYLGVYVDAVEWVELPNTLGMSQYADGGRMASKPYAASGQYIQRMSNYCRECRFRPKVSLGKEACPFTTLYWDFLMRHEARLRSNRRILFQLNNVRRLSATDRVEIRAEAGRLRRNLRA